MNMVFYKNLSLDEVIELLKSGKKNLSEVIRNHKDSEQVIIDRFHELGYYKVKKNCKIISCIRYKEAADKYVELGGFPNTNIKEIALEFKISPNELADYVNQYYPNTKIMKRANFNEDIFDNIDTEEKAYWLGFMYADGSISSSPIRKEQGENVRVQYQIELLLAIKDFDHLKKFAKFLGYKIPIWHDDKRCRVDVYSQHMWRVLNVNGCTPKKSLTLKFPREELFRSPELVYHFIRGYVDGDGCLSYSKKEPELNIIGTYEMMKGIVNYISEEPVKINILHPKEQSITKYIALHGKKAYKATKLLYENATIYLERKYERYLEFCRLYEKSYEESQSNIGEVCDDNTEIIKETKESLTS